ncbi:signal-regulatory protein beta-2-like isoform X2 [Notamacropus eugenii]|uniref:signal-regulatory protein beta-2-like isoform X2 n=1 Tax=Notamacropus eugenii TaxID=9315 RepID=UPI003B678971
MFSLSFWALVLLTLLNIWAWADTQNVSIEQPSSLVRATIGGSAVLECRSKTDLPAGPVKWFKGTGPNRELIYSDTGSYSRVQKVNNIKQILDIRISNITSQDEGVYYCIKFKKSPESEFASGGGTHLIVDTQIVSIEQPSSLVRATIGGSAVLECRSKTDLPAGPVKWFKGTGPNRELIYSDTGSYSRVQKVNNTKQILDIRISNITSQDEGVYYCIKFKKSPESEFASGGGTHLIVGPIPCLDRSESSKKNQSQRESTENNEMVYTDLQPTGKNHESDYATLHVQ